MYRGTADRVRAYAKLRRHQRTGAPSRLAANTRAPASLRRLYPAGLELMRAQDARRELNPS